ncbi:hypothetical protein LINPERHAP2_LOCUS11630 [Linum perenne]
MNLRGGAFRELESFFRFLESQVGRISLSGEQKLEWRLSSHLFSVKSLYSSLAGSRFPGLEDFPSKGVWSRFVPSKICCFIWRCLAGHIATLDFLQRMGILLQSGVAFVVSMKRRCIICSFPVAPQGRFGSVILPALANPLDSSLCRQ